VYKDSVDLPQVARTWGDCPVSNLFENDKYDYPFRTILYESIRNLYFHVPMWFGMILIFIASVIYSIRYLMNKKPLDDIKAKSYAQVGILYGVLGIITGGIWAQYTWGAFWSFDIKQNMSAIALLIYMAYFVLRGSFDDFEKRARLGAVYNIFAFATLIPLLFVIPRLYESLHPGNGGNPGFGGEDLDNTMRTVFYPAVIGWTLLGLWIGNLVYRLNHLKWKNFEDDDF
jgi:heme exporter protein C